MPAVLRQAARRGLIAQQFEQFGAGPDERDPGLLASPRQGRILGEKTIARVNRVDALFFGQRDDAIDIQVSLDRAFTFADQISFVGFEAMQAEPVFLRIDGDSAQPQFIGGAHDADGDFAAIECKKFFHGK